MLIASSHVRPAAVTYVKAGGLTPDAAVVQPADGRLVDGTASHQVVAVARPGHRRGIWENSMETRRDAGPCTRS